MTRFAALMERLRTRINERIKEILAEDFDSQEAKDLIGYTFKTRGKRLRPLLLVLSCEAVGGNPREALDAAVAVELIHAATLIFDDIIDKESLRRGFPALHVAFHNDKAISAGLFLASKGVQILSGYKDKRISETIGHALVELSKGEILDIITDFPVSPEHYLIIADLKTGSLFGASAAIGGIVGGGKDSEIACLSRFGRLLGVAFQIKDDAIDALSKPSLTTMGVDRRDKILAHYISRTRGEGQGITGSLSDELEAEAVRKKALRFALRTLRSYVVKAKRELRALQDGGGRSGLERFADYAIEEKSA